MNTAGKQRNDLVKAIRKMTRFLRLEKINYDEYASNLIIHLVEQPLCSIEDCLSDLSTDEKAELVSYARSYFAANNFEPHPTIFMVDTLDHNEVERKRQEMRPKFEQLLKDLEELEKG